VVILAPTERWKQNLETFWSWYDDLCTFVVTIDGVLGWIFDLLTTLTHDSQLHLIRAPSLISTHLTSHWRIRCLFQHCSASVLMASLNGGSLPSELFSDLILILILRPTDSRPVCLGIKHPSGAYDQNFITFRHLRACWYGALCLTRGRVCRLQLLLALASAVILRSESRGTRDHILLSQIRDFPFHRLLWLAELRWRYSSPLPQGIELFLLQLSSLQPLCTGGVENTVSKSTSIVACISVSTVTCLPSRCLQTALVYLLISRSLHSNGSTRYTIMQRIISPIVHSPRL
jgi:hypothetical protein